MKQERRWAKYTLEFISIFIAVISAFALENWNENRRNEEAAIKILIEISNGLEKDLIDININKAGHVGGIHSCMYWRNLMNNQEVNLDSLRQYYLGITRDFFSAQNNSGYETLKSRGLELIKNDSLRFDIISLYEYDYESLKTMEENYFEMQFQANYFEHFNKVIAPNFEFGQKGNILGIKLPLKMSPAEKNIMMSYLWKIQVNRNFIMAYYIEVEKKIQLLTKQIELEIKKGG